MPLCSVIFYNFIEVFLSILWSSFSSSSNVSVILSPPYPPNCYVLALKKSIKAQNKYQTMKKITIRKKCQNETKHLQKMGCVCVLAWSLPRNVVDRPSELASIVDSSWLGMGTHSCLLSNWVIQHLSLFAHRPVVGLCVASHIMRAEWDTGL